MSTTTITNQKSKGFFGTLKEIATETLKKELAEINNSDDVHEKKEDKMLKLLEHAKIIGADLAAREDMLANELDRALKKRICYICLIFIAVFTVASYVIIVLNSVLNWNIPNASIIALIVETPIQFIGILYIIARNLFPNPQ